MLESPLLFLQTKNLTKFPYLELVQQDYKFLLVFRENRTLQTGSILCRHNYVTFWLIVMILICMDGRDPNLYYGCKENNFMGVDIAPPSDSMFQTVAQVDEG